AFLVAPFTLGATDSAKKPVSLSTSKARKRFQWRRIWPESFRRKAWLAPGPSTRGTPHGSPTATVPAALLRLGSHSSARSPSRGPPTPVRHVAIRLSTTDADPSRHHGHGAAVAGQQGIRPAPHGEYDSGAAGAPLRAVPESLFHCFKLFRVDARRRGA